MVDKQIHVDVIILTFKSTFCFAYKSLTYNCQILKFKMLQFILLYNFYIYNLRNETTLHLNVNNVINDDNIDLHY